MASRVVVPKTKLIQISKGDWIMVKERLNHGEYQELLARRFIADQGGTVTVNLHKSGWEQIGVYLVDWSLEGLDGNVIPIQGKSPDEIDRALCLLDDESVTEIKKAISAHVVAMEAARVASKKTHDGATESSATSPSLVGAAGDTSGSESSTATSITSLSTH